MDTVLSLCSVSKRYQMGAGSRGVWQTIVGEVRHSASSAEEQGGGDFLWALQDLDLNVTRGEAVGVVGHNGAGKTTLLKLLSRVTRPTSGTIEVSGRISSLIELGAGFHPELTGRENVTLNGTILGMSRADVRAEYQAIVDFAELEPFMDVPVKRYSSGMYARLGFSVAVHTRPDILLVDEVLSVGDAGFALRCIERMRLLREAGTTILLVSHNLSAVESLCERVLWIDHGRLVASGAPREVLADYLADMSRQAVMRDGRDLSTTDSRDAAVSLISFRLEDSAGLQVRSIQTGDSLVVICTFEFHLTIPDARFWLAFVDPTGASVLAADMRADGVGMPSNRGRVTLECNFDAIPLNPRSYSIVGGIFDSSGTTYVLPLTSLGVLEVEVDTVRRDVGDVSVMFRIAPVHMAHRWNCRCMT